MVFPDKLLTEYACALAYAKADDPEARYDREKEGYYEKAAAWGVDEQETLPVFAALHRVPRPFILDSRYDRKETPHDPTDFIPRRR